MYPVLFLRGENEESQGEDSNRPSVSILGIPVGAKFEYQTKAVGQRCRQLFVVRGK
jgi:hypothetical protein